MDGEGTTSLAGGTGRLVLDVTRTAQHGGVTGMQRVVRQIARYAPVVAAAQNLELEVVAWNGRRYVRVSEHLPRETKRWVRLLQTMQHRRRLRYSEGDVGVATEPIAGETAEWMPAWMERTIGLSLLGGAPVKPGEGDVLMLVDAPWNSRSVLDFAETCGATVGLLLHDLVPLQVPETCEAGVPGRFRRWVDRALAVSDFVVTVSEATRLATQAHIEDIELPALPSASFRLGADLSGGTLDPAAPVDVASLRPTLPPCLVGEPTVVCVGTFEPRKNHGLLLDAFEKYWAKGGTTRLLLIGNVGWGAGELMRRLDQHAYRGQRLLVMHGLNDHEVTYAYRLASGVVCPSLAEGFGLPIIEALAHGCHVIASDIPAHREAGGDRCTYFPPGDVEALSEAIGALNTGQDDGAVPVLPTWRESTEVFLRTVGILAYEARVQKTGADS